MNEVSIGVPYIFGTNKIQKEIQKEDITEHRGTWYQERPAVGPNRPERGKANSWELTDK